MGKEREDIENTQFNRLPSSTLLQNRASETVNIREVLPRFKGSATSSLSSENLQDGCVLLGKNMPAGNRYVTRYVINRKRQREDLCSEVMQGAFCPCTFEENKKPLSKRLWTIISSEAAIFTLHMTVLVLGVAKEALDLRTVNEDLHLIHSAIETLLTILTIVIRVVSVRGKSKLIKGHVTSLEYVEDPTSVIIQGQGLRNWLHRFYLLGVILIVIVVTCFLLFYFLVHLGWTILSNNFCLEVATVASNLLLERLDTITDRICQDHHKAVIYESGLLLQEAYYETQTTEKRASFFEKARRFSKALMDTELFERPEHIERSEQMKPHWDAITTIEMQSFV